MVEGNLHNHQLPFDRRTMGVEENLVKEILVRKKFRVYLSVPVSLEDISTRRDDTRCYRVTFPETGRVSDYIVHFDEDGNVVDAEVFDVII